MVGIETKTEVGHARLAQGTDSTATSEIQHLNLR
jgi:hypothetical protein